MREWIGKITGILCIMTVILQLIPQGSFAKYVRFYVSLLYMLAVAAPLLQLFSREDSLERFLNLEFLKEEYYDLGTAVEGLQDLKDETLESVYRRELINQFAEIADICGAQLVDAEVLLDGNVTLQEVKIKIRTGDETTAATGESIRKEISAIYGIGPEHIRIEGQGGWEM